MQKILIYLALMMFMSSPISAGQEKVNILVDVLEASEQPGNIDPGLAYIKEQIQRAPFRYQRYRTLASTSRIVVVGRSEIITFSLPEAVTLELNPVSVSASVIRIKIRLWQQKRLILATELSLARRGTVIIGGPSKPGTALMIALSEGF